LTPFQIAAALVAVYILGGVSVLVLLNWLGRAGQRHLEEKGPKRMWVPVPPPSLPNCRCIMSIPPCPPTLRILENKDIHSVDLDSPASPCHTPQQENR